MFLLDTNIFICAHRDYYPPKRVPEFWDWLAHHAEVGSVKVPEQIWNELKPHDEVLAAWIKANQDSFILDPDGSDVLVPDVLAQYGDDLTEAELEQIGADPFLIAAALGEGAVVVSKEGSKPTTRRVHRRIPDICKTLGVQCITDHKLIVELDFSTNWRR